MDVYAAYIIQNASASSVVDNILSFNCNPWSVDLTFQHKHRDFQAPHRVPQPWEAHPDKVAEHLRVAFTAHFKRILAAKDLLMKHLAGGNLWAAAACRQQRPFAIQLLHFPCRFHRVFCCKLTLASCICMPRQKKKVTDCPEPQHMWYLIHVTGYCISLKTLLHRSTCSKSLKSMKRWTQRK